MSIPVLVEMGLYGLKKSASQAAVGFAKVKNCRN